MENSIKFDIKYDYSIALVFSEHSEMLIGGSEKTMKKAFKNSIFPNLNTKGLDVYYREKPIGTLAADINQSALDAEKVQNLVDKLYANLLDKRTNNAKIADTKISLDALFRADRSVAIRVLARTISVWYDAVTNLYMNGKFGIPLKQNERTALGEQFRYDVNTFIATFFTVLKKKISPHNNAEIHENIILNCVEIREFLAEYSRYLSSNSVFCIHCKLCGGYFILFQALGTPAIVAIVSNSANRTARKYMPKNAPREYIKCGRQSNSALRISYTKTSYGEHCPMMIKPSITRSARNLSQLPPLCSAIMSRAAVQIGNVRSGSTSKEKTAKEPRLRAGLATSI